MIPKEPLLEYVGSCDKKGKTIYKTYLFIYLFNIKAESLAAK